jgi:uncharacterized protein (DUF2267 family)
VNIHEIIADMRREIARSDDNDTTYRIRMGVLEDLNARITIALADDLAKEMKQAGLKGISIIEE